jgi:hypothetical protein
MKKIKNAGAKELIRELKRAGFKIVKPVIIKLRTGKCKVKGCKGIVGKLWPIALDDIISGDGVAIRVILAYPCNKCGALHGTPEAEEIIKDRRGNRVFYQKKRLVFKNQVSKTVYTDTSRIRCGW